MKLPQPDQQPCAHARRTSENGAAMDTFTLRLPRWLVVLFSRNPLIRVSDRIETLVVVSAVVVSLLAMPIAAAVGTAVYDSRSRVNAEQAQNRMTVTATVIDRPARSDLTRVHARWFAAGSEHVGAVRAKSSPKPGESIEIPVNQDGSYAGVPAMSAAKLAVFVALAIWLNVTVAVVLLCAGSRVVINRSRHAGWRPDLVDPVDDGNRRSSRA